MLRFLALTSVELQMTMSRRARRISLSLIVFALLLPLLFILTGGGARLALEPVSIAVVDTSGDPLISQIRDELGKLDLVEGVHDVSFEEARHLLDTDEITIAFVFPDSFSADSFASRERHPIAIYLNPRRSTEGEYFARFADELSLAISELQASYYAYVELIAPFHEHDPFFASKRDLTVVELFMRVLSRNRNVTSTEMPAFDMFSHLVTSCLVTLTLFFSLLPLTYARRDRDSGLDGRYASLGLGLASRRFSRLLAALPWFLATLISVALVLRFGFLVALSLGSLAALICLWLVFGLLFELFGRRFSHGATASLAAVAVVFTALLSGGVLYPRALLPRAFAAFGSWLPSGLVQQAVFTQLKTTSGGPMPAVWLGLALAAAAIIAADELSGLRGER